MTTVPVGLTERQRALLTFIQGRLEKSTICPSFDEMAAHLGLKSKSGVLRLVEALVERGHLVRLRHRARAIALPKPEQRPVVRPDERQAQGLRVQLGPYLSQRLEAYCRESGKDPASVIHVALHAHLAGGRS
ncbi:LexA family protein [Methylorubrum extorquens]|uniref:LexA family protein n=1 Tax=Methylorubrum extorquens TaxID=408 RepID=UPI003F5D6F63